MGEYRAKVSFAGEGKMWIPPGIEEDIEHDEYVPMEPVSTWTAKIRITSIEKGQPYIF